MCLETTHRVAVRFSPLCNNQISLEKGRFKWEDTMKSITQVDLQQVRLKKITNNYKKKHTVTCILFIIRGKCIYKQLQFMSYVKFQCAFFHVQFIYTC